MRFLFVPWSRGENKLSGEEVRFNERSSYAKNCYVRENEKIRGQKPKI